MSYAEEDTFMSYEEEVACMPSCSCAIRFRQS
jgi:hypothetical protein